MKRTQASHLPDLVANLQEKSVLREVRRRLGRGEDPLQLVRECQEGVHLVGERYEQKIYYISGLIMAGEIMQRVGSMVFPLLEQQVSGNKSGTILIGTVQGDIHHIGKGIVTALLRCYGFTVVDIGVNVPPHQFRSKAEEIQPDIVGLSCLINSSYPAARATVELLRSEAENIGCRPPLIIGGLVDQRICDYVGADAWTTDSITGVRLCQKFVADKHAGSG